MTQYKQLLLGLTLISVFSGCVESPAPGAAKTSASGGPGSAGAGAGAQQKSNIFSLIQENVIDTNKLNSIEFKISHLVATDMPGVSYRMYLPMVSTALPKGADYIELLRCTKDLKLIEDVKREAMVIAPAKSWSLAEKGCDAVVKKGISTENIIDFRAKKGEFYYVARACVRAERMTTKDKSNCSDLISISPTVYTFEDVLAQRADAIREEMARARDEVSAINLRIQSHAVALNNAQARCEVRTAEKQKLVDEHNSLVKFLSFGARAAEMLIGSGLSNFNAEKILDVAKDAAVTFTNPKTAATLQGALKLADPEQPLAKMILGSTKKTTTELAASDPVSFEVNIGPEAPTTADDKTGTATGTSTSTSASTDTSTETKVKTDTTTVVDRVLQNTNWGELRASIEGMSIKSEDVISQNPCPGVAEVKDNLRADTAELLANQISIGLMDEAYKASKAVKDKISGMGQ